MRDETEVAGGGVDRGRETGHWTYKGEFGVGGAVIMTMIEARAKTGAGSWDHLA